MHHRGEDCMNQLSSDLLKIGERIANEEKEDMSPLANDEKIKLKESMSCHICNRPFNTGSNYDFHLLIKELAKKLKSEMGCIGKNTETYNTFSVEIQKEEIDEDNKEKQKISTYRLKFIDSYRFIKSSLERLVDNLS